MDLFGSDDDWESRSGYGSMIHAEARLRNLRRVAGPMIGLHRGLMQQVAGQRAEYLAWVESHPVASIYIAESTDAADDEVGWTRDETSVLIIGSIVGYGFSVLETALADAYGDASRGREAPTVRGAKLEGWLGELRRWDLEPAWDDLVDELDVWRARRNAYAHELHLGGEQRTPETPDQWDVESFLLLLTNALEALDRALADRSGEREA